LIEERAAAAERVEAALLRRVVTGAPAEVRAQLGVTGISLGGGVCLALSRDPSGYWSKTVGLGRTEPVTADLVKEVVAFYETYGGESATLQVHPDALPEDWDEIVAEHGLEQGHPWVKLVRPGDLPVAPADTSLRVGRVGPADVAEWGHVLVEGFGLPHAIDGLFTELDDDAFTLVAAWDGDRMVGAGTLFVDGGTAQLGGGSTLPTHRGRGAQSAMIALRLQAAQAAGVTLLSAETGVESPGTHNASLHNMRRAGFTVLYERANWVWRRRG
jgi:GNAT superfamily N-acetyltransferase